MLYMLIVKASTFSEAGEYPSEALQDAMSTYNQELIQAGVRVMAKGLHPSSKGLRISFSNPGEAPVITEGAFPDPQTLVAGFILIDVDSHEDAVRWALRMPDPMGRGEGQIELRQVYSF